MRNKKWIGVKAVIQPEIEGKSYCFAVTHSGHDYPARITNDPEFSEPADFEIYIDEIKEGYCDGEEMTREQVEAFFDEHYDRLVDELMEELS